MTPDTLERAIEYLLVSHLNGGGTRNSRIGNSQLIQRFFNLVQRSGAVSLFCDVGANDGSAGVQAKSIFPRARVVSLEANPHIHATHAERLKTAGVESLNIAACSVTGPVTLHIPRVLSRACVDGEIVPMRVEESSQTGKSSLLLRDENTEYEQVRVPGVRLDDLLADTLQGMEGRSAALWIDVEGAAFEVLSGALETLEKTSALLIETENFRFWKAQKQSGEIARLLIGKGFLPLERDSEYGNMQFNTTFVHGSFIDLLLPELYAKNGVEAPPAIKENTPAPARRVRSLRASLAADIPIYIPTFNNPTFTRMMVEQLHTWNLRCITLVDNGSTYAPMVQLLDAMEAQCKVVWLGSNAGPHFLLKDAATYACLPEIFCITDPDLLFQQEMPQEFLMDLLDLTHTHKVGKAGLALDLQDKAAFKQEPYAIAGGRHRIWEWEAQFWTKPAGHTSGGDPVFKADIDTTFALYNKRYFTPERFYDAVRLAGRYACRHLPWYRQNFLPEQERQAYCSTQKYSYYGS